MAEYVYALEKLAILDKPSIFLAGTTPRLGQPIVSWRKRAVDQKYFDDFDGHVVIPETRWGETSRWKIDKAGREHPAEFEPSEQYSWEHRALTLCDAILFWVPRDMAVGLFGLTTNIELGWCLARRPSAVVYGRPDIAEHVRYIDWLVAQRAVPFRTPFERLDELCRAAAAVAIEQFGQYTRKQYGAP